MGTFAKMTPPFRLLLSILPTLRLFDLNGLISSAFSFFQNPRAKCRSQYSTEGISLASSHLKRLWQMTALPHCGPDLGFSRCYCNGHLNMTAATLTVTLKSNHLCDITPGAASGIPIHKRGQQCVYRKMAFSNLSPAPTANSTNSSHFKTEACVSKHVETNRWQSLHSVDLAGRNVCR